MKHSETRHLLYHLYPRRGSLWRFNVELLVPKLRLFNGVRLIHVATDETTEELSAVQSAFTPRADVQFAVSPNHPWGETPAFAGTLLPAVAGKPGVTFYAHGKGTSHARTDLPNIAGWTKAMTHFNLQEDVPFYLDTYSAVGIYRCEGEHCGSSWHYSGTFFWFRNQAIFQNPSHDWRRIAPSRYGVEAYLGSRLPLTESYCLYREHPPCLYQCIL